ncbi:MAG: hypothetical protein BWY83_03213 [bacterium ADurb.Bin478]|nr:MAG: hypothetical protein BWY83_03213 [bacterium ADurb.Bin478]
MQHPEIRQSDVQLGFVVRILIVALRRLQRNLPAVFPGKPFLRLLETRMHLDRKHLPHIQNLEQIRQLALKQGCGLAAEYLFRIRGNQFVQIHRHADVRDRRKSRMRAHPQLSIGLPIRIVLLDQPGDEFKSAPGVMLHPAAQPYQMGLIGKLEQRCVFVFDSHDPLVTFGHLDSAH